MIIKDVSVTFLYSFKEISITKGKLFSISSLCIIISWQHPNREPFVNGESISIDDFISLIIKLLTKLKSISNEKLVRYIYASLEEWKSF